MGNNKSLKTELNISKKLSYFNMPLAKKQASSLMK